MSDLTNYFSWSSSRAALLAECTRAYYLAYYGSWNGWESTAPQLARFAYALKKSSNRFEWWGKETHSGIKEALLYALKLGRVLNAAEEAFIIRTVYDRMKADFAYSKAARWAKEGKRRPDFTSLTEHIYRQKLEPSTWLDGWRKVETNIRAFFAGRWQEFALSHGLKNVLALDEKDFDGSSFRVQGVKVFAIPDLAIKTPEGAVVFDWKTGKPNEEKDEGQLVGNSLFLESKGWGQAATGFLVYLNEGLERPEPITPDAKRRWESKLISDVATAQAYLSDVEKNVPSSIAAFPKLPEGDRKCSTCRYRLLCERNQ